MKSATKNAGQTVTYVNKKKRFKFTINMDFNTKKLCRLCLQSSDDVINIWQTFNDSTIASILAKHFWFQVRPHDIVVTVKEK